MSISGVDNGRDLEMFNRRLKEREEQHAAEVEGLNNRHHESLDEARAGMSDSVRKIKEASEKSMVAQKEDQQKRVQELGDRFESQAHNESKGFYDKYGKLQEQSSKEAQGLKDLHRHQVDNLIQNQAQLTNHMEKSHEENLFNLERASSREQQKVMDETKEKLQRQSDNFARSTNRGSQESAEKLEKIKRENFEASRQTKQAADLRLENTVNQNQNELSNYNKAFGLREKQLVGDKNLIQSDMALSGKRTLDENKNRINDGLNQVVNENNFANAKKNVEFSNALSELEHRAKTREQDLKMGYERSILNEKGSASAKRDRDDLKSTLEARRSNSEKELELGSIRNHYEDAMAEQREQQNQTLHDKDQTAQLNFENLKRGYQKTLTKVEEKDSLEGLDRNIQVAKSLRESAAQNSSEKYRIARNYEEKARAYKQLVERQTEGKESADQVRTLEAFKHAQEEVQRNSSENQGKLALQKLHYESVNKDLHREHAANETLNQKTQEQTANRLATTYRMTLEDVTKMFESQMDQMRRDDQLTLYKSRLESDAKLKEQSAESEFANKSMAQNYESRITEMKQAHDREMGQIKMEHEKALRTLANNDKNTLETSAEVHRREMAALEAQMKERQRLQEINHKTELAKLKNSNELLSKKS